MFSHRLNELEEHLLHHSSELWGADDGSVRKSLASSGSLPSYTCFSPSAQFHESISVEKQAEYLRSTTESGTESMTRDDYLQGDLGPTTKSKLPPTLAASLSSEFPGHSISTSLRSSSGFFGSSSGSSLGDNSVPTEMGTDITTNSGVTTLTSYRDASNVMANSISECDDLAGINPFDTGTEINIQQYLAGHELEVIFCDLENRVFEKQQSRKDKQARQRIINGKVEFLVRSEYAVKNVRAWVRREIEAAELEKDANGMVSIEAVFIRKEDSYLVYQVDLDSVYEIPESNRPVYKLAKYQMQVRNQFELLVQVEFSDDEVSDHVKSKPFMIKTKSNNDELAENLVCHKGKRKRPHTCPGRSSRWSPVGKHQTIRLDQHASHFGPDSTDLMSSLSPSSQRSRNSSSILEGNESQLDQLVVKHLEAQQANIGHLSFGCMMQTSKGDIAYHLKLTNPDTYHKHEEGLVVGFFPDEEGEATIHPLTSENAPQAVMAGVISRSAYLEAHAPLENDTTGQTDIVCVIGMVKVQVMGSVRTGERIYASTDDPGKAIPESHLPLGAFVIRNHTLLGMAMEGCKLRRYGEVNSVKCFVCIVLGINSFQLASEVENIMESIDADIKVAIGKSNETNCRRMFFFIVGLIVFLGLLGFFMYELLTPGSLFRYFLCRTGSCPGHHLSCHFKSCEEESEVHFIQFDFNDLKEKIPQGIIEPEKMNSSSAIYFLNHDRCAYAKNSLETARFVNGPMYLASKENCSDLFAYVNSSWKNWAATEGHQGETVNCKCSRA
ncbi:uncharacterized protein [Montipora capricornis]|uniref:uncharacterized protein n=1 Tax=Montipora capricornis TaxID=246305 RepID=UPI0035F1E51C